jgi:hypothetical protein
MNRNLTDMEDDSDDLEVEQLSYSNESSALKVVAARKVVHLSNDFHGHDRARFMAGDDAWSTYASSGDPLNAQFQINSDPIHYSDRPLLNPKGDSHFMSPQSQSPASFKYNAEASPFRAFDSPRVGKKKKSPHPSMDSANGNFINIESKRNFSITPGPYRNQLSSADEDDVVKPSTTAVHDSPQQFHLFNSKASTMSEWMIPMSFITAHHNISTSQLMPSTIPASPDILDIVNQVVSEQQFESSLVGDRDYIDDHSIAFQAFSPSKASATESRMDLDICSIARDMGTLNLHKSASFAKDFSLPYGDKHVQHIVGDLGRSYSIGNQDANADCRLDRESDRAAHHHHHHHRSKEEEEFDRRGVAILQLKLPGLGLRQEPYVPLDEGGAPHNGQSMRVMEESDTKRAFYSGSGTSDYVNGSSMRLEQDYVNGSSMRLEQDYVNGSSMRLEQGISSGVIIDPKHAANVLYTFDTSSWDSVAALSAPKHDPNYEPQIAHRDHRSSRLHGGKGSSHSHHHLLHSNKEDPAWSQLLISKDSDTNSSIASNHSSKRRSDVNHASFSTARPSKDALKIAIGGPANHAAKQDFMESPRSKAAYKDFLKHFRSKEKDSPDDARRFALDALPQMPENAKWRVYLELADLAKRHNLIQEVSVGEGGREGVVVFCPVLSFRSIKLSIQYMYLFRLVTTTRRSA